MLAIWIAGAVALFVLAAGSLVLWVVRGHNKLVHAQELCGNALSQIGVQQASRWDALTALAELTREYASGEYTTLMDTIRARQGIGKAATSAQVNEQEGMLQKGFGQVNALAEAYPELKSNTLYLKTMDEIKSYEDKVRISRMVYNDAITKYNRRVRSLPGAWLAHYFGFVPYGYLEDDPAKENPPAMAKGGA